MSIITSLIRSSDAPPQESEELEPLSKHEFQILMALVGCAALAFGVIVHMVRF